MSHKELDNIAISLVIYTGIYINTPDAISKWQTIMPALFEVRLRRVGNSMVVSVPVAVWRGLSWNEGDTLELIAHEKEIIIAKKSRQREANK